MNFYRHEPRLRKRGITAGILIIWLVGNAITCIASIARDQQSGRSHGPGYSDLPTARPAVMGLRSPHPAS